ncbi:MAG: hypothetical protein GXO76_03610 [Calditrichaeota bacterium]|nr:hypothetical protein [Calditrichota bacterium]
MWTIVSILLGLLLYVVYVKWSRLWNLFLRGGWVILTLYAVLGYWYFRHF